MDKVYSIAKMEEKHLREVSNIEKAGFSMPWSYASFEKELKNKMAVYNVALDGDAVVAYAGMWHIVNEGQIISVIVEEKYRGLGIGDKLIKSLIRIADDREMIGISLEVRKSNILAQRLYKKNGFYMTGIRKEYYEDNREDAILMWKDL